MGPPKAMHISAHRTARRNTTRTTVDNFARDHTPRPNNARGQWAKTKTNASRRALPGRRVPQQTVPPHIGMHSSAANYSHLPSWGLVFSPLGSPASGTLQKNELIGLAVACVMWFCEHFLLCAAPLSFWPLATQVFEQVEARPEQIFDLSTSSARRPTNAPTDALSRQ